MDGVTTILLLGCTGNGKSATGNSILGRKAFKSKCSFQGVTTDSQMCSTKLQDGQILNVIDTPGFFDSSISPQHVEKEIVKCIEMAKDGIHAIVIVVSLKVRLSKEQVAAIETVKHLFGTRIVDYMIVAFTSGDELDGYKTLDDHLAHSCPEALKELLEKCGNRQVVFDNKSKDEGKKGEQLDQLLTLVNDIVARNEGKTYTHDLFVEFKNEDVEMGSGYSKQVYNEEQIQKHVAKMVHKKLKERNEEIISMLEEELEKLDKENEEMINKLEGDLERAQWESNESAKANEDAEENSENETHELSVELEIA